MKEVTKFSGKIEKTRIKYWSVFLFKGQNFMLSLRDLEKARELPTQAQMLKYCEKHGEIYDTINETPEFQKLLKSLENAYFSGLKGDKILALQLWGIENHEIISRYTAIKVAKYAQIPRGLGADLQKAVKLAGHVSVQQKRYGMLSNSINSSKQ